MLRLANTCSLASHAHKLRELESENSRIGQWEEPTESHHPFPLCASSFVTAILALVTLWPLIGPLPGERGFINRRCGKEGLSQQEVMQAETDGLLPLISHLTALVCLHTWLVCVLEVPGSVAFPFLTVSTSRISLCHCPRTVKTELLCYWASVL